MRKTALIAVTLSLPLSSPVLAAGWMPAAPAMLPSLGEWGLIGMLAMASLAATWFLSRRRG